MKRYRYVTAVASLAGAACFFPTGACGCPPAAGVGIVAGAVTRADGTAAAGAEVRVEARVHSCALANSSDIVGTMAVQSDAAGRYRFDVLTISPSDTACLRVVARASRSATDSAVADGIRMRLMSNYRLKGRPDSIRIDLQLPSR